MEKFDNPLPSLYKYFMDGQQQADSHMIEARIMYICICKGITDSAIRDAVCQGACRMRDLKTCLGVGTQCGKCACHAKQVLNEVLADLQHVKIMLHQPSHLAEAHLAEAIN
ncbi:bacterioferritin-associated ferredoxin (modular protein) [Candidatus Nitrotoga sp. HW29]|uniref:bacterioferritin-associated ferredoxin n=1 Tax=Candidatus Nitrotoga sp. HW29 TaxID=2886963 RepID=UPI001EF3B1CA|nr:bacterioferritin-associated ferredoxin [Candidatus Nitrotoga sp. HW29]CAH1905109.1 bacterioferritin-associated ferredoxin (modular protein) [Candidatus Nitrotoga sp. HW29]